MTRSEQISFLKIKIALCQKHSRGEEWLLLQIQRMKKELANLKRKYK